MTTDHPLDHFHYLHCEVLAVLDQARPYLNGRDAESWTALAPFRGALAAALHALQLYKHRELFDPILAAGGPDAASVRQLKAECIKLGLDYQAYTRKWASADIDARWPEYRLAGLAMMRQIRDRMAAQHEAIHRLYAVPDLYRIAC
ncbi:hypothetical protein U1872_07120 [Sphingomonas sp. RB3P16]|uniref:hypothetical protein n=1 Tax=Parasphingomonas frigoris TaxID=3096163 RepID=UPI002FC651B2